MTNTAIHLKVVDVVGTPSNPKLVCIKYWDNKSAHEAWFASGIGKTVTLGEQITEAEIPPKIYTLMENKAKEAFEKGVPSPNDAFRAHGSMIN